MRAVAGRPVLMQRFPHGASGSSFFQKRVPDNAPEWLETTLVSTPNGTTSRALVAADLAHLVWAVNLGCLGFHVWPYRAADPDHADELRLDLDPQPGVGLRRRADRGARGDDAARRARRDRAPEDDREPRHPRVRAARAALGRVPGPLGRGRGGAGARAPPPDVLTDAWWKEERGERVFIDFNQNAPHKTVFGAWSARARPGGQVSTPFTWDELDTIHPDDLTIASVPARTGANGDPWAAIDDNLQSLEPFLAMHERDLASGLTDAPWPPVYPKMPGEPPRVAPSRAKKPAAKRPTKKKG